MDPHIPTPVLPSPVLRETFPLPAAAPGTERAVRVLRFGTPGARPKAYLQAGLHADEFPGMLVLRALAARLEEAAARGEILGEIIVLPLANPIGFAQQVSGFLLGRYDLSSLGNFNRDYADLAAEIGDEIGPQLGPDPQANIAAIRAAMTAALARMAQDMVPAREVDALRHLLLTLAHDADFALDLHADNQAVPHMYLGTPLWPGAQDLAADIAAQAVLLAEVSGGHPFDEACGGPWWTLAKRFPDHPIPPACLSATLELGCNDDVDEAYADATAAALLGFLQRRGVVAGAASPAPAPLCDATGLDAMQQLKAPMGGLVSYIAKLGATVRAGEVVARIIDPQGPQVDITAGTDGILFARHSQTYAWPGKVVGKVAGAVARPERRGKLLPA